jgi:hypothetical protein
MQFAVGLFVFISKILTFDSALAWLRITPVFRKRYDISFRFRQKRTRNNAEITRNRALFSEITKNTANFGDTIYRNNTQPSALAVTF